MYSWRIFRDKINGTPCMYQYEFSHMLLSLSLSHTHRHTPFAYDYTVCFCLSNFGPFSTESPIPPLFFSPPSLSSYIGPMTLFARRALKGEDPYRCQYSPADENRNSMEPWQSLASLCSPRCKFGYASSRVCLP